jgi:hypothetical protein
MEGKNALWMIARFTAAVHSCAAGRVKEKVLKEMGEAAILEHTPAGEAPGQTEFPGSQSV